MSEQDPAMHSDDSTTPSGAEELTNKIGASSGLRRDAAGRIDVMASVGGVRGIVEAVLPGFLFVTVFALSQQLNTALIVAIAVGVVFMLARLVAKTSLTQSFSGLIGILICALAARTTGEAKDYYVPGFFIVAAYIIGLVISIAVRWPLVGVLFSFIRQEGTQWREQPARLRAYAIATWIMVAVFAARLAVQLPLYFSDHIVALGISRLIMGLPLYAGALWFAWLISRAPAPAQQ